MMKMIGQTEVNERTELSADCLSRLAFNMAKRAVIKPTELHSLTRNLSSAFSAVHMDNQETAVSVETIMLNKEYPVSAYYVLTACANKLLAAGYEPNSFVADITIGEDITEQFIKEYLRFLSDTAVKLHCSFSVGNASNSSAFQNQMIISVFAMGKKMKDRAVFPLSKKAEILFVGYLAMEDTSLLSCIYKDELLKRLPSFIIESAMEIGKDLSLEYVSKLIFKKGVIKAVALGRGGIEAALYELADSMNVGFNVDMNSLPIRQETVEVCEVLKQNLYKLNSNGAMLIVSEDAEKLREYLLEHRIKAELIGEIDSFDKAKRLIRDERTGYLDRP